MPLFSKSGGYASQLDIPEIEHLPPYSPSELEASVEDSIATESESMEQEVETLNEVQVRLLKADYYNALLKNPLFGPNEHPLATEVENEVRQFVMTRLRVFLGMAPDSQEQKIQNTFDDQQLEALAMWANKLLKRPAMYNLQPNAAATKPEPVMSFQVKPAVVERQNVASTTPAVRPAAHHHTPAAKPRQTTPSRSPV